MRNLTIYILALLIFCVLTHAEAADWNVTKSTHFVINYQHAPDEFLSQLKDKAETYYSNIADSLGFTRYDFWLWDNRAQITIYDDANDYRSATKQPSWSAGCASLSGKIIQSYSLAENFLDTVLPHELGHIIFRELVGFNNPAVPLWLDEGVASYQEKSKYAGAGAFLKQEISGGKFIPLEGLANFAIGPSSTQDEADLFYAEAFSAVDFLIKNTAGTSLCFLPEFEG